MRTAQNEPVEVLAHSLSEVVASTGFGLSTIRLEIDRGHLVARKLGRRTVVLDSDLREWLAAPPTANAA